MTSCVSNERDFVIRRLQFLEAQTSYVNGDTVKQDTPWGGTKKAKARAWVLWIFRSSHCTELSSSWGQDVYMKVVVSDLKKGSWNHIQGSFCLPCFSPFMKDQRALLVENGSCRFEGAMTAYTRNRNDSFLSLVVLLPFLQKLAPSHPSISGPKRWT